MKGSRGHSALYSIKGRTTIRKQSTGAKLRGTFVQKKKQREKKIGDDWDTPSLPMKLGVEESNVGHEKEPVRKQRVRKEHLQGL